MAHIQTNINGHPTGWKKARQQVKKDWVCPSCKAKLRYFWVSCPACSHPRPH